MKFCLPEIAPTNGKFTMAGSPNTAPVRAVGEHEYGWYLLDFDDDHIAEGTDPTNWDTDGDWMVDWFEVHDDEEDGVRGDSSQYATTHAKLTE